MGSWSLLQYALLFVCWLAALATLLVFLETWLGISGRNRFMARRASGAYGVISVFVPMHGIADKTAEIERAIRSIFGQSYPFIELVLIYWEEDRRFAEMAKQIRGARSHIPVRTVPTLFPIDTANDRIRALEHAQPVARGRWFVVLDSEVILDRFAVETAIEFAGSNEISALVLRPGVRCRSFLQKIIAPSMEHILQMVRIANRRREKRKGLEFESSFLLLNREAFEVINKINRMPGILNDAAWNLWGYQIEGLRTFASDGSRWMWRDASVCSWSSNMDPERRYGASSVSFVIGGAVMAALSVAGLIFGLVHGIDNFAGASILAFSGVNYLLMWTSYFLFARRLRAAAWFAPLWVFSYIPAAALTLIEIRRTGRAVKSRKHSETLTRS
ncbi:MAG TPA: glycosyltransferase family A protein [Terriglobia bacterium]